MDPIADPSGAADGDPSQELEWEDDTFAHYFEQHMGVQDITAGEQLSEQPVINHGKDLDDTVDHVNIEMDPGEAIQPNPKRLRSGADGAEPPLSSTSMQSALLGHQLVAPGVADPAARADGQSRAPLVATDDAAPADNDKDQQQDDESKKDASIFESSADAIPPFPRRLCRPGVERTKA